jgi:hypothetical protein
MRCTAKSKQSQQQCKKNAVPGFDVCEIHGGKTPAGAASPHYRGKDRSKHLNPVLLEAYRDAQNNQELLSIRDDIALTEALLVSSLPRIESRESGKAWTLIKKAIDDFEMAFANENYGKCTILMRSMRDVVDENVAHFAAEDELRANVDMLRKLKESERKRLTDMQQMVTSEQAMLLVSALLDSVRRNVTDSGTLNAIQSEFIRLTTQANNQRVSSNSESD